MVLFGLCFQSRLTMEDRTDSPMAVKVERHSQYVILTYFQGDINSMVDAHFTRALGSVCKAKAPAAKTKKIRKTIKLGKHTEPADPPCLRAAHSILLIHPTCRLSLSAYRGLQHLSGERRWTLLRVTRSSRTSPDLQPCRRRSWIVAIVHCPGRRRPGVAVHHVLPVPRGVDSNWTAILHIPAQPAA